MCPWFPAVRSMSQRFKNVKVKEHSLSCPCFHSYYVAVLFYVFMSLKSLSGTGSCLSAIIVWFYLLIFFVILEEFRQTTSTTRPCAIVFNQFQDFGSLKKTPPKKNDMSRVTSIHCSLIHSQPTTPADGGGAHTQLGRKDTTGRYAHVNGTLGN